MKIVLFFAGWAIPFPWLVSPLARLYVRFFPWARPCLYGRRAFTGRRNRPAAFLRWCRRYALLWSTLRRSHGRGACCLGLRSAPVQPIPTTRYLHLRAARQRRFVAFETSPASPSSPALAGTARVSFRFLSSCSPPTVYYIFTIRRRNIFQMYVIMGADRLPQLSKRQ